MAAAKRAKNKPSGKATNQRGYPRPQLVRQSWTNLNGQWDFAIDADAKWSDPTAARFDDKIEVPFAPESPASGVNNTGFYQAVWYRRTFKTPELAPGERLILHFGAVDHEASVWVNGKLAATHVGGYTPFCADITDQLTDKGEQTIVVRAYDDPQDLAKPRGKQDWRLEPHSIWYYRTTGIWQTVWMEVVPATRIDCLRWVPDVPTWSFSLSVRLAGPVSDPLRLRVKMSAKDRTLVEDVYSISSRDLSRRIELPDPGIDDYRNELYWFPHSPNLIDAEIELIDAQDNVIDRITSYTAMRSVMADGNRFVINNRPTVLRLVLDQGYWPESGLTSPDDDALKRDVELVKELGFNGVRKHQKIEDPRFLYWADKLGIFVWEEMPSPYTFSPRTVELLTREWMSAIERDVSHPCIICWVPFNESWGVPDLVKSAEQRDFVRGIYYLTKSIDTTRPVIGNDGWEIPATDIIAIHDYERVPETVTKRYVLSPDNLEHLFTHERPGHRQLLLDGQKWDGLPIMLTEFGGIAFSKDHQRTWGYKRAMTESEFGKQYEELLRAVRSMPIFSGFCYTQFTDTYQEANGVLYMDRSPKLPIKQIADATGG